MKKLALLFGWILLLFACNSEDPYKNTKELSWLKGKWSAHVEGSDVNETWTMKNDSTWIGKSAFLRDGKALFTEVMSIRQENGKLIFVSAVSDQNEGDEVVFTEIQRTAESVLFENKNHDFPQRIAYVKKGKDKMMAYISGNLNGEAKRIDFHFSRIQ